MPRTPGVPLRGAASIREWEALLQGWVDELFGASRGWSVTVSERPEEQHCTSKRRDDVRFHSPDGDSFRTYQDVLLRAKHAGRSAEFLDAAARRASGAPTPRGERHRRDDSDDEAEQQEPSRRRRRPREEHATAAPEAPPRPPAKHGKNSIRMDVTLPDGCTAELQLPMDTCAREVRVATGLGRQPLTLCATLPAGVGGAEPRSCLLADHFPLRELLPCDGTGGVCQDATLTLRLLRPDQRAADNVGE